MKTKRKCLSDESLDQLIRGTASPNDENAAQHHLDACEECCLRMRAQVGNGEWWREAEDLLADMQPGGGQSSHSQSANAEGVRRPSQVVLAHLKQWVGPTDDPSKLGRVGSFEVIGIIGVGGGGIVLKAFDPRLNRFVAIKTLLPALSHSAIARRRFERESRAVAAITHQHVVPIFAVDNYNGIPYIAMQYVAGQSLQRRLDNQGPLQTVEVVRIAAQIASALSAAHSQGVIHRDIKPANILMENSVDRVMVTDFGLARVIDEASTHSGAVTETPQYMSPEQCHGQPADQRSDLFSLGSVMYAMSSGRAPFRSDTLMGMLRKVCEASPRDLRELNTEIPEWLKLFIDRLLQKRPDDRFESASQVAELLETELAYLQNPALGIVPSRDWLPRAVPPLLSVSGSRFAFQPQTFHWRLVMPIAIISLGAALMFVVLQPQTVSTGNLSLSVNNNSSAAGNANVPAKNRREFFDLSEELFLDVRSGGRLKLDAEFGHIEIKTGDVQKAKIELTRSIWAPDEVRAKELATMQMVECSSDDGNLSIRSTMSPELRNTKERSPFKEIKFIVTVPKKYNLVLRTAGGHIQVMDIAGKVELQTAGGHLSLANVEGPVVAKTEGGHIKLGDTKGNVEAHTSGGHITLGRVQGTVRAETSGGNIRADEVQGFMTARTSGGNIVATLTKQPAEECKLVTDGGSVQVSLAKDLKLALNVQVAGGKIMSPFSSVKGKLNHQLNGGGPALNVSTNGGNAQIGFIADQK